MKQHVKGFLAVSDCVTIIKLKGQPFDINIIQLYAPTADSTEDFDASISSLIRPKNTKSNDINIFMGDWYVQAGAEKFYQLNDN